MSKHEPVLHGEVMRVLAPRPGEVFADLTAGFGGHASSLLDAVTKRGFGYLFDQDPEAIKYLRKKFSSKSNVAIEQQNFADLDWDSLPPLDMIFADLGVSSVQLDTAGRGFSFQANGPLDMRMNTDADFTAADIINTYKEDELANIIYQYGEERRSRLIAHQIVELRKTQPVTTTQQLTKIIETVVPRSGRIHPATRTFQALRIAVNDELGVLQQALTQMPARLSSGGRIAIISFHSLEDRIVKQFFKSLCTPERDEFGQISSQSQFRMVTKKPIKGSLNDTTNPRARSAMLRAVEKIT